ncbi:LysR substrate-binding domain-containing protein [Steroidobacter agaridevorans]|uniref:LysR substrate-binding domain-containing protein n=1 Tax=Steroidobacter agaridevorans TaxID=2695856 RepID=UPI001324EC02|nr:LysR substrate-binding domain-containing protein [Steroidobacter agaridevorans]GFE90122.1 LysR family transcriptional regulator [Steroidobacter agaridevorans]
MRKLPLSALRAFAYVFETGGVRPAARALQVTHSAISRQVRELEAWLGVALIEKPGRQRRFAMTIQGQALGKALISGLNDLERAVESVRELRAPNSVVITTTPSLATRWLMPRLPVLAKNHPSIELSIVTEASVKDLAAQGADLALRMGGGPWPDGICEPLMDELLYPVATRGYWKSLGERKPARALAKARLLHDRDPDSGWDRWFDVYPARNIDLRVGPRFTSSDLVLQAAAQGLGVALARGSLAEIDVSRGILFRPFEADHVRIANAYWLVRRRDDATARPAMHAVIEWIKACAAKRPT